MNPRATVLLHLVCWWGLRILGARWMRLALFAGAPLQAVDWWLARLLRSGVILALILGWIKWRKLTPEEVGLGGAHYRRNFAAGLGGMLFLGLVLAWAADLSWSLPGWSGAGGLAAVLLVCLVDVLAQQAAVFGLLQLPAAGWGRQHSLAAFAAAWISFGAAHFLIDPPAVVALAWAAGALFGWAAWRSKNLGLGAGVHFGYYLFLAVVVGEIRMW